MSTMTKYWPNIKDSESSSDYDEFWEHEWTKHGTCSQLAQTDYFNTTITLVESFGTPSIVTSNVGGSVSASSLRSAFGGTTKGILQCDSGSFLSGVFTCWSMDSSGHPSTQMACPQDVQGEDTCSAETIKISAFQ